MKMTISKVGYFLSSLLILAGCAALTSGYGRFLTDETVTKNFEAFQIDPDMNYYTSGSDTYPSAILGLKKKFILDNDLWKPLKSNPWSFKELVQNMQDKVYMGSKSLPRGFTIYAPDGEPLGVWYSIPQVKMIVERGKDNKVVVYTPDLGTYLDDDDSLKPRRLRRIWIE